MIRAALPAIGLLALVGAARAAPNQAVLDRIDAAAKTTQSLSAEFTQKNRMKLFRQELSSRGRLYYKAPRQIRWEYLSPDPSTLLLDGGKATMRSPGTAAQVFDLDKDTTLRAIFDQLLTFVGGGSIDAAQAAYQIDTQGSAKQPRLLLVPRAESVIKKTFARIELSFDDKAQVRSIHLVETNGDEKEIVFGKVERNRPLPAGAFAP